MTDQKTSHINNRDTSAKDGYAPDDKISVPFGSNAVRLSGYQWIAVGIIVIAAFCFIPTIWEYIERFEPDSDYRIPYDLSNDYWLFNRWCRLASSRYSTLVIGDSVIWGQYVEKNQTISHYLNEIVGIGNFANLGVDGTHPVALAGLLKYYGRPISGKNIILHCNLLWMSSKRRDLQVEKEFRFNHPKLAPQFIPNIPCYTEPCSKKLGIVIERDISFFGWTSHLRLAYFDKMNIPSWTLEHPYSNPLTAIKLTLPEPKEHSRLAAIPWTKRGMAKQKFPWVQLNTSFQWRFFQYAIEILKRRGNRIFVLVGPLNEHILKEQSLDAYKEEVKGVETWLQKQNIPYYAPPALASQYYADASHPLKSGYAILAKQLSTNKNFARFIGNHKKHFPTIP